MTSGTVNQLDRFLAAVCAWCPLCRNARRNPSGVAARFVAKIEGRFCPFCRAYARVAAKAGRGDTTGA